MTNEANANMKKKQMLEALDYIDDDIISGVLKKIKPDTAVAADPALARRTPFKYWKHLVALAACAVLLSMASPLVSYIAQVISNFNAGAGSGVSEQVESIDSTETEEPLYLEFTPELEPISKDLIEEIKDAYWIYKTGPDAYDREAIIELLVERNGEEFRERAKKKVESEGIFRYGSIYTPYYGIFNDCVVAVVIGIQACGGNAPYEIAGYKWSYASTSDLVVYHINSKTMYEINEAYNLGLLIDEDIAEIYRRHQLYREFCKENKKKYPMY